MAAVSGYITRSNLPSPLSNLDIFVDPYPALPGDSSGDASSTSGAGIEPGISAQKTVWADSPFVAGQQLVHSVDDNSTLNLRILIDGADQATLQSNLAALITAVREQMTFQVSVTIDTATYTWNCYRGDYQVGYNEMLNIAGRLPVYLTMPRDPTPVAGPV